MRLFSCFEGGWFFGFGGRIVLDPDVIVGKPVIKGTRIPVYLLVEFMVNGMTEEEVLKEYPQLRKEEIRAALLYVSKCLKHEVTNPSLRHYKVFWVNSLY